MARHDHPGSLIRLRMVVTSRPCMALIRMVRVRSGLWTSTPLRAGLCPATLTVGLPAKTQSLDALAGSSWRMATTSRSAQGHGKKRRLAPAFVILGALAA